MLSLDMLGMYVLEPGAVCDIGSLACKEVGVALGLVTFGIMKVPSLGLDILSIGLFVALDASLLVKKFWFQLVLSIFDM
ncbi:hypothetical protein EV2_036800 [Malus domestica]